MGMEDQGRQDEVTQEDAQTPTRYRILGEDVVQITTRRADRPDCPECDSKQIYVLQDGTVVCRACGARTAKQDRVGTA